MLSHKGTVTLETDRLILRKYILSDAEDMFNNWACDPEVARFVPWKPFDSAEAVKEYLNGIVESYKEDIYQWVILYKQTNTIIGGISVVESSEKNERVEIGYNIGQSWWNQGITTEALKTVIHFLFECVNVHRIQAIHNELNPASGRVMQKAGMALEGVLKQHSKQPDGYFDNVLIYAVVKEE